MASVSESSVLCNLAELMQLESERVQAEQAAARERIALATREAEARTRAEQARAERARERALAQEMQARDELARRDTEREAALLRTRLELQAKELLERERTQLEHERALRQIERADRSRHSLRWLSAAISLLALSAVAAYARVVTPALDAAHAATASAQRDAEARSAEASALRRRVLELEADASKLPAAPAEAPSGKQAAPDSEATLIAPAVSPKVTRKRGPRLQAAQDPLPLGEMEGYDLDNDPLKGLEGGTNKRR